MIDQFEQFREEVLFAKIKNEQEEIKTINKYYGKKTNRPPVEIF